jgi:hypothetical protein
MTFNRFITGFLNGSGLGRLYAQAGGDIERDDEA